MLRKFVAPVAITLGTLIPAFLSTPASAGIILPDPYTLISDTDNPTFFNPYGDSIAFGDFIVYSLPLLNFYATGDTNDPNSGDPFNVVSTPGAIKDDIVVATGSSGTGVTTNTAGMDGAYATPNTSAQDLFQTSVVTDPGQVAAFTGDTADTWDITADALLDYLNGDELIFFFNLNDTNRGTGLANGQDLLAHMTVTLWDDDGDPTDDPEWVLDDMNGPDFFGINDWAYTHGKICVGEDIGGNRLFVGLGGCTDDTIALFHAQTGNTITLAWTTEMNQNLGANQAAFAVIAPGLVDALVSGMTLQADINLGFIDNGYEQIFIQTAERVVTVPEPATLGIMGMGLLGMAWAGRRRRRSRSRR